MEYALYLGCTIPLKVPHFEFAFREIANILGYKFKEMDGASCCPDPVATQSVSIDTWLTIAARNLCIAEKMGLDILTICSGCYETLKTTKVLLEEDKAAFNRVNSVLKKIGYEYKGTSKVYHFVELFAQDEMLNKIKNILMKPMDNLNVAVHYGCHLIRPSKILQFDHPERPETMDKIIEAMGAKTIAFAGKLECCGFCARLQEEIGFELVEKKMTELKDLIEEVDVMVGVCPACVGQYDRKQRLISRKTGKELDIPVLYLPELMAIAFGVEPDKLGLTNRSVRPKKLMEKLN
ncbi:MAG: CoB--CoM heterodisulfide reductase iron-sulfur subunit B family protein, partial [Candidatus Hodarchaeota archaeon]